METPEPRDSYIGRKAVELGLITAKQLAEVLLQISQVGGQEPPLLGDTLVTRGLLTRNQLGVLSDLAKGGPPKRVGKYHVKKELGRGGMGIVYEAEDPELGRRVALKTLLTGLDMPDENRKLEEERFLREARLCANLAKHPHIVGVYETGAADDQRFIAMEYIEGRQFSEWAKKLSKRQQVTVLRDVALAVEHAHRHGVIHRDLKPANILVDADNQPHVTDFGLAKRDAAQSLALTVSGEVMGTPAYMSPEQAEAKKDLDHRSDIWSLGVMLYEILTGRLPFIGETPLKVIMKTAHDPVPPPSSVAALGSIDSTIEAICMKALSKKPEGRPQSAKAFADELTRWLKREKETVAVRKTEASKPWLFIGIGAAAVAAIVVYFVATSSPPEAEVRKEAKPREGFAKELTELDVTLGSLGKSESFGAARDLLAQAARRHDTVEWSAEMTKRSDALKKRVRDLFDQLQGEAEVAKSKGRTADVDARKSRVDRWAWPGLSKELDDALAKVAPPAPPPPPPPPPKVESSVPILVEQEPFVGHTNAIHSVAFSPDGRYILTSAYDGAVRLWDTSTRKSRKLGDAEKATSSAMSPDGKWLASGYWDGKVLLWDLATLEFRTLTGHSTQVLGLEFTPDSRQIVSGSTDGNARLWEVAGGVSKVKLDNHPDGAMCLSIGSSGESVVVGSAKQMIRLWELPSGRDLRRFGIGSDSCHKVCFMPDGKSIVSGLKGGQVMRWDPLTGEAKVLGLHSQAVRGLAVSPDGRWIASAAGGDPLKIWDGATGAVVATIPHENAFFGVAFSRKGDQLAAGCGNHTLKLWSIKLKPK